MPTIVSVREASSVFEKCERDNVADFDDVPLNVSELDGLADEVGVPVFDAVGESVPVGDCEVDGDNVKLALIDEDSVREADWDSVADAVRIRDAV